MPNQRDSFATWRSSVDRRLRELATLAMGRKALTEVTSGEVRIAADAGFWVIGPNGVTAVTYIGKLGPEYDRPGGFTQIGVLVRREDGTLALAVSDPDPNAGAGEQIVALYDRAGNEIVSDDQSGQGIARPYIPVPFVRSDPTGTTGWPFTTSNTFVDQHIGTTYKQQARVYVQGLAFASTAATVGQVKLLANGVQVDATMTLPAGANNVYWTIGPVEIPGAHLATVDLRVQARRTAGTGNFHTTVTTASQYQS